MWVISGRGRRDDQWVASGMISVCKGGEGSRGGG